MIGSGKSPTNLEAMSLNHWNIVDLAVKSQLKQWIQKSNVVKNQINLDLTAFIVVRPNVNLKLITLNWCVIMYV